MPQGKPIALLRRPGAEAPQDGQVGRILIGVGQTVDRDQVLMELR